VKHLKLVNQALSANSGCAQVFIRDSFYFCVGVTDMRNNQVTDQTTLRSSDTLFRPDFMLRPQGKKVLPTPNQLSQRKALNTSLVSENNVELVEIEWWQDR
jgi:hypothetical protein